MNVEELIDLLSEYPKYKEVRMILDEKVYSIDEVDEQQEAATHYVAIIG